MQNRSHELQGVSHIRNNYKFFTKKLEHYISKGYRIEEIYGAFLRLKIVAIGLESWAKTIRKWCLKASTLQACN